MSRPVIRVPDRLPGRACGCLLLRGLLLVGVLWALTLSPVNAQPSSSGPAPAQLPALPRTARIGVLTLGTLDALQPRWGYFVQRLAEHGYVEGQNLTFERRAAEGDATQLAALAGDLVAQSPDVIFAAFTPAVLAAKQAKGTIPIVIPFGGDPVGTGLVESFEHPGTNVTGMSDPSAQVMPSLVRVFSQAMPGVHRVAIFTPAGNPAIEPGLQASRALAAPMGIQILRVDVAGPTNDALDAAFDTAAAQGADGFVFYFTPTTPALDRHAAEAAAQRHLPGIYETRGSVDAGGLMSQTVDYNASFARTADYVNRILDGADPADMAIGVPEQFNLIVNLKAATTQGITFPPDILAQATEVIQ